MKANALNCHLLCLAKPRPSILERATQIALASSVALLASPSAQALEAVWLGGTGNWEDSLAWSTLAAPFGSSVDVLIGNSGLNTPSHVLLNSSRTIGRLSINRGDSLSVLIGGGLRAFGGSVINNGSLNLVGSMFILGADTTFSGSGSTVLSHVNSGYSGFLSNNSHKLTIAAEHTVRGSGYLGGSGGIVNKGLVLVEGSAPLDVEVGYYETLENSNGVVKIADGAQLNLSGRMNGGRIEGVGSAKLQGGSYQDLTLAGTLEIAHGASIVVSGTLTNHGTLSLSGGSDGYAVLNLGANTTLAGSGSTVLSTTSSSSGPFFETKGYNLTIAADHTLRGSGYLRTGYGSIVNKGLVVAEGAKPLNIQMDSTSGKIFDNTNGVVRIADGAALNLSGTMSGGRLEGAGSAKLHGGSYQDLTLAGTLEIASGHGATASGTLTNQGTLSIVGSLALGGDTTLAGGGSTVLSPPSGSYAYISNNGHSLTIAADHTVRGSSVLGDGSGSIVNKGLVLAEGAGPLYIQVSTTNGKTFDNTNGIVRVADGATLNLSGTMNGGRLEGAGSATLKGGSYQDLTLAGRLEIAHKAPIVVSGTITNHGTLSLSGGVDGFAVLNLGADTTFAGSGSTVLSQPSGSYSGQVSNSGHTLTIAADHTVRGRGHLGGASGSIVNQGLISADAGTFYIHASQFNNSQGQLHIGSKAQMAVDAPMSLADPSLLSFDIAALSNPTSTAGSMHGLLKLSGNVVYDGRVLLDFSGYQAQLGDHFTLINTSGSFSGGFDGAWGVGNGLNYGLTIQYGEHDVSFTISNISAVPEPGSYLLMLSGLGMIAWLKRSAPGRLTQAQSRSRATS